MIRTTYLVAVDLGDHGQRADYIREARVGATFFEVVDDIILGDYEAIVGVYKLDGERFEDVSADACAEIIKYASNGHAISTAASEFADFCGFVVPNRQAAE